MVNIEFCRRMLVVGLLATSVFAAHAWAEKPLIHDAEYYVLEAQNGARWQADDEKISARLAEFRQKNGGKPPNIVYILLDAIC